MERSGAETVLVTRPLPERLLTGLPDPDHVIRYEGAGPMPDALFEAALPLATGALVVLTDRVDARRVAMATRLRAVASISVGVDHLDLDALTRRGILATHTPGVLTAATADLTLALMLALVRRLPEGQAWLRDGHFRGFDPMELLGLDLEGATLGIVGYGRIGQAVARRAHAFGMRILTEERGPAPPPPAVAVDRARLLAESDVVSLHCPLTEATRGMVNRRFLEAMKRGAYLVNTARGALVDEAALVRALDEGRLAGAGIDVWDPEPPDPGNPLLGRPDVVALPHMGSAGRTTRERMVRIAVADLVRALAGERPVHLANPEAWERRR